MRAWCLLQVQVREDSAITGAAVGEPNVPAPVPAVARPGGEASPFPRSTVLTMIKTHRAGDATGEREGGAQW
jgi:hypothetical protein